MHKLKSQFSGFSYIIRLYVVGIVCYFFFRLLLLIQEWDLIESISQDERLVVLLKSLFMGFRFDTVISGYILALPYLIVSFFHILFLSVRKLQKPLFFLTSILYVLSFLICAIDIPYFKQFFSRLSISAFAWLDTPDFVLNMVLEDMQTTWVAIPFLLISIAFIWINNRLAKQFLISPSTKITKNSRHYLISVGSFLIGGGLIFLGIRGRVALKSPIRVGTAFFSNYPFPNKLGLNPNFTLIRSWLDTKDSRQEKVEYISDKESIENMQSFFNASEYEKSISPIARKITFPDSLAKKHNIVIVIMESMSATKMGRFGNSNSLTPFLDSLSNESYFFNDFYTTGIHTFSGMYGTLMSLPTLKRQHPFKGVDVLSYSGIATTLKRQEYETVYFTTHDDQFDNIGGTLKANGFDRIVSQKDYPKEEVKTTLGVPDDYMFRFSKPILNEMNSPFLSVFMTTSDHVPYFIPPYFEPKKAERKLQIVEYADWSIKEFIESCRKEEWFDNTIFVFLADHGGALNVKYELPLNFHHSPLLIYAPSILPSKEFSMISSQLDVFPTIMGLLKLPYINNTMGIDLLKSRRPYAVLNNDDKYGVLSKEKLLIVKDADNKSLYQRNAFDNIYEEHKLEADSMEQFAKSLFQTTQWLIENRKTGLPE
ncbi:MAG: phosphoglycerol transferase MdoB-like AlkP superfamily enzyme [Saprospiraceae bacterium]|jgi:phosphoglycerol transferase MdoB-like AlkP superfamily enzyme